MKSTALPLTFAALLLALPLSGQEPTVPDFSKGMPDVKLERKQNIDGQEAYRLTTTLGSKEFSTTLAKFLGVGWRMRELTDNEKFSISMARTAGAEVSLAAYGNANLPGVEIRGAYLKEKKGDAHARIDVQVFRFHLVRDSGPSLSPDGSKRLEVTRRAGGGNPDGIAVFDARTGKKRPGIRVMDAEADFAVLDSVSGRKLAGGSIAWHAMQGFFYWETSSRLWGFGSDGEYFKLIEFKADGSAGETMVDTMMPVPRVVWDNLPSSLQSKYKAEQAGADQSAPAPESKPEGDWKPDPESKARSR